MEYDCNDLLSELRRQVGSAEDWGGDFEDQWREEKVEVTSRAGR